MHEIKLVIFYIGNTLAVSDKIPSQVNKETWPIYREEITYLFQ